MSYKGVSTEMVRKIGEFTILNAMLDKKYNYGRLRNESAKSAIAEMVAKLKGRNELMRNLAEAIEGRMDLHESGVEEYVGYILEDRAKVEILWTDEKRKQVCGFINSEGQNSIEGGLLAIYRIRNNLFHGIKFENIENCAKGINSQVKLFDAMIAVLEEVTK